MLNQLVVALIFSLTKSNFNKLFIWFWLCA